MMHPDTELRRVDARIGYGVFATQRIPRGTIVWTLCALDRLLTPRRVAALPRAFRPLVTKYSFVSAEGRFVLCWDFARFVNHSCDATSYAVGEENEIVVRDVLPGEQITSDYAACNIERPLPCRCGASNCRRVVRRDDILTHGGRLDAIARAALQYAARVRQPLRPFVRDWKDFSDMVRGRRPVPPHIDRLLKVKRLGRELIPASVARRKRG